MKATGIVRRIDDLGRVVIPKELRRILHLNEGDPLEIFTEGETVIFRKYHIAGELQGLVNELKASIVPESSLPNRTALLQKISELEELIKTENAPGEAATSTERKRK